MEFKAKLDKTSVKLVGAENGTVNGDGSVTVANQGTYRLVKDETGANAVTFTPFATFTGKAHPVTVSITDTNGTEATTTYTPSVTPVKVSAEPATSTGTQGSTQSGTPIYTAPEAGTGVTVTPSYTLDNDSTTKTVDGVGTYTIDTTGKVTFVPVASYVSSDANKTSVGVKVTYRLETADKSQATITSETTYTPTVNPVTSAGNDVATTNIQGHTQKSTDEGKALTYTISDISHITARTYALEGADNDGKVVVENVGTYTVDDKGQVTFVPVPSYVGTPTPVTVVESAVLTSDDKTTAIITTKSMYTPTVTAVTPTGASSVTEGARGTIQTSPVVFDTPDQDNTTVNFNKGHEKVELDKSTLTLVDKTGKEVKEVVVPGEGTYVLKDGVVEFIPEKDFVGKATPVTVQVKDVNGKVVSETYTPTVRPVTEFKDTDGNVVSGSTTEDGKVDKKDFPGYRFVETKVDNKGNTTHIYEKVTTTFKDKEGNLITVDKDNNPVKSTEKGEVPAKTIPGYKFVETKKLPNGDIEHIYEKVSTFFKDKEGKELPNYPSEPGTVDKKDIPDYRFVETKKLPNGDTEHIYEKVKTSFKDKEGNEIPNYPSEPGTVDKKDIPGYRFVETKKLSNGDTVHVYEKVTPPAPQPNPGKQNTTTWTDENGNPLKPTEPGSKEPGTIPGYEYVKTVTDSNGNIRHIFRKVEMPTPTPVEPTQPAQPVEPATPAIPEQPAKPQMPATPKYVDGQKELPNTGTEANASLAALGLLGALSGFGLLARKKKED